MVYLGGPQRGRRNQLRLRDAPPGYRPPQMPASERQKQSRQELLLFRVAAVILILLVTGLVVVCAVVIATRA
jgi:hypothetical protein